MKRKITIFFILTYTIFSCNSAESIEIESYLKDSITFSINTKMNVTQTVSTIASKAIAANDELFEDLNMYIFDEKGNLFDYSYTTHSSDLMNIKLTIWKGAKYSIYGIANTGKKIYAKTIKELIEKSYSISSIEQISSSNGGVLMTGHTPPTILIDGISLDLTLTRSVAKISFQIDLENLSDGTSIEITKVSIKNIPNKVNLFKKSRATSTNDIIIEGDSRTGDELRGIANSECSFYIYENMQGSNLLPSNKFQTGKIFNSSDPRSKLCSYLEVESKYNSPIHSGMIKHRFYLGEDSLTNFNIIRNKHYTHTLTFNKLGINEVSWRVDIGELKEYITSINLSPSQHIFQKIQETKQISASILPHTADNKSLEWSSSNPSIATVDQSGTVTSISNGTCTITATTSDGSNKTASCEIEVLNPKITISCQETMFQGESAKVTVTTIIPNNAPITWSSSNEAILTIDQSGNIQALGTGTAIIKGKISEDKYSEYTVTVVPLTLTLTSPPSTFYKGFKDTITYSITPTHAQTLHNEGKLPITWTSENENIDNKDNIYWSEATSEDKIIGYFTNHSNVRAITNVTILEAFSFSTEYHNTEPADTYIRILNNAKYSKIHNKEYSDISINHPISIQKHSRANISWSSTDSNIDINSNNQIYCIDSDHFATNGKESLTGSIVDDFKTTHSITIPLRIYEEVNITVRYWEEKHTGNMAAGYARFISYIEPSCSKETSNIDFSYTDPYSYTHSYSYSNFRTNVYREHFWNITGDSGWNKYLLGSTNKSSSYLPRDKNFVVTYRKDTKLIEDTTSPDGYYRYYVSLL